MYDETNDSTDGSTDGGLVRDALGPIVTSRPVSSAPYEAIVAAGRRRVRTQRLAGAAVGLAVVAGTALAVPALAAGGPAGGSSSTATTAAAGGPHDTKPTPAPTVPDTSTGGDAGKYADAVGKTYPVGSGSVAGHSWSVSVGIVPQEKSFQLSHPGLFPRGGGGYADIPYGWFLPTVDGQSSGFGNLDLVSRTVEDGNYLTTLGVQIGKPGQPAAMLEYGPVNDPRIDHYGFVYSTHTDIVKITEAGGYRFVAFAVSITDQPQAVIVYDKAGNEIGRESGYLTEFFRPGPQPTK